MRFHTALFVFSALAAASCRALDDSSFPSLAVQAEPHPQYRVWWEVVESCSEQSARFEAVKWFRAAAGHVTIDGESAAAAWFSSGNRIVITDDWNNNGPLVRHEILHAVLQTAAHPAEFFEGKCADEIACGRGCGGRPIESSATEVDPALLQVDGLLWPRSPSLRLHGGWTTIGIRVRNPMSSNVFVAAKRFAAVTCEVGFRLESVEDPERVDEGCGILDYTLTDARIYFRAGESRRLLFDVDLRSPDHGGAFKAELVKVSTIYMDRVGETKGVLIRP